MGVTAQVSQQPSSLPRSPTTSTPVSPQATPECTFHSNKTQARDWARNSELWPSKKSGFASSCSAPWLIEARRWVLCGWLLPSCSALWLLEAPPPDAGWAATAQWFNSLAILASLPGNPPHPWPIAPESSAKGLSQAYPSYKSRGGFWPSLFKTLFPLSKAVISG